MNYKVDSYLDNSGKHLDFELPFKKKTIQIIALISSKAFSYFQNQENSQFYVYINTGTMREIR